METTLLALALLLLTAALVLLWRLQRRVAAVEDKLRALATLDFVPDRLQLLAKRIEGLDLDPLHAAMDGFGERMQRLEDLASTAVPSQAEMPDRRRVIRALVVRALRDEGFESVRILSDEDELDGDSMQVRVQAVRRGVQCSGKVEIADGGLAGIDVEPSYSAYP